MKITLLFFITIVMGVNTDKLCASQAAAAEPKKGQMVKVWNPAVFLIINSAERINMSEKLPFDPETMEKVPDSNAYKIKPGHEDKFKKIFAPLPMSLTGLLHRIAHDNGTASSTITTHAGSLGTVSFGKMANIACVKKDDEAKK